MEAALAERHLHEDGIAMFDLSSSWVEETHCELAARGYSRDRKKARCKSSTDCRIGLSRPPRRHLSRGGHGLR
jgi:hypothetical protein